MRSAFNVGTSLVPIRIPIQATVATGTTLSVKGTWPNWITGVYEFHAIGGGGGGKSGSFSAGLTRNGSPGDHGEYVIIIEPRPWAYGAANRPLGGAGGEYSGSPANGTIGQYTMTATDPRADGGDPGVDTVQAPNQIAASSPFPFGTNIGRGGNGGLGSDQEFEVQDGDDGQEGAIYVIKIA